MHFHVSISLFVHIQCSWIECYSICVRFVVGGQILNWTVTKWLGRFNCSWGLMRRIQAD